MFAYTDNSYRSSGWSFKCSGQRHTDAVANPDNQQFASTMALVPSSSYMWRRFYNYTNTAGP